MKRSKPSAAAGSSRPLLFVVWLGWLALPAAADEIRIASSILTVSETVQVPAPAAGILRDLNVHEGMRLVKDASIAGVDAREQEFEAEVIRQDLTIARRESESDVRIRLAEKENRVAESEWRRATSVNSELPNTVSAKEVDRLRLAFERTELEIEHARFERDLLAARLKRIDADLRLAEHRVERMRIASPIAGVVAEVHREAGEWVDAGEPIVRLVRVDRLRVEGYLGIADAVRGLIGRPVRVTTRLPDGEVIGARGRVVFVSPEAEPVDAKVRFWAEVDNSSMRLRPGLTASVVIGGADAAIAARAPAPQP